MKLMRKGKILKIILSSVCYDWSEEVANCWRALNRTASLYIST